MKTPDKSKLNVNARSVTPRSAVTLSASDIATVSEYLQFAIESLSDVITHEEKYRDGNRSPILGTLKRYREDGIALLARITKQ